MTVVTEISMPVSTAVSALVSTAMSMRVPGRSPVSMNAIAMIAMAMAVSVAAMTAPAEADFLYVPPREPVAAAESGRDRAPAANHAAKEETSGRGHGVPRSSPESVDRAGAHYAGAEPLAKSDSPGSWQVHAGEMLREALGRWGERAGVEVMFLTDRRYRLHEGRAFEGAFDEAARTLFYALSHLPHPPVGEMRPDGRTLAVMHEAGQSRSAGDGR